MSKTIQNNESWENIFEYLTEDITMYGRTLDSWDGSPEGYTQADLLWKSLNCRSKVVSGLSKFENVPNDYKERFLELEESGKKQKTILIILSTVTRKLSLPLLKKTFLSARMR